MKLNPVTITTNKNLPNISGGFFIVAYQNSDVKKKQEIILPAFYNKVFQNVLKQIADAQCYTALPKSTRVIANPSGAKCGTDDRSPVQ